MLNPQDLEQALFSKSFKGYNVNEVDEHISYLTSEYAELYSAFGALEAQYKAALEALEEANSEEVMASNTVKRAIAQADEIVSNAKKTADEMINNAKTSSEETLASAKNRAEEMVAAATARADEIKNSVNDSCDSILNAYREKVAAERDKLIKCEDAVAKFKDDLYDAYRAHIKDVDSIIPDVDPTPFLTDEELEARAMKLANEKLAASRGQNS